MKKNLNVPVLDWSGEPYVVQATKDGKKTAIRQMAGDLVAKLLFSICDNQSLQLSGDEKLQAYRITKRICDCIEGVELSAEDIVLLKKLLCPLLSVGAYGQIVELLEK